jgi:pimeloyl-ACP methyl ester carboxylesterase
MIHGFPDFWYTWRNQMNTLMSKYQVAAIDLRGYNLSDKPQGGEYYLMRHLISDIQAVMRHLEKDKAIIMGHDWGGAIAWFFAIYFPTMTERLIVLDFPHPSGFVRELAQNPQQQEQTGGIAQGSIIFLTYSLGMGLIMIAVSIAIGISNQTFVKWLKKIRSKMNTITGIVLILAGSYLIYYNLVIGRLIQ